MNDYPNSFVYAVIVAMLVTAIASSIISYERGYSVAKGVYELSLKDIYGSGYTDSPIESAIATTTEPTFYASSSDYDFSNSQPSDEDRTKANEYCKARGYGAAGLVTYDADATTTMDVECYYIVPLPTQVVPI